MNLAPAVLVALVLSVGLNVWFFLKHQEAKRDLKNFLAVWDKRRKDTVAHVVNFMADKSLIEIADAIHRGLDLTSVVTRPTTSKDPKPK